MTINRGGVTRPLVNHRCAGCPVCLPPLRVTAVKDEPNVKGIVEQQIQELLADTDDFVSGGLEVTDNRRWFNFGCRHWLHYTRYSFTTFETANLMGVQIESAAINFRYFCRNCGHWFLDEPTEPGVRR